MKEAIHKSYIYCRFGLIYWWGACTYYC